MSYFLVFGIVDETKLFACSFVLKNEAIGEDPLLSIALALI